MFKKKKTKQNCARTFHIHVLKDELHMSQPGGHPGVLLQRASSSFDILQDNLHFPYNTETKKYISDVWLVSCDKVTQEFCHSSLTINITKCQTLEGKFLNKMHYSAADDILHVWKLSRHTAFLQHLRW